MSGSRAGQLIEAGVWLRLSGDLDWSERLFEEASRLDPSSAALHKLKKVSNAEGGIRSNEELWSLLSISVRAWPNPFLLPDDLAPPAGVADRWNRDTVWRAPDVNEPPLPEIDLEPIEFEEFEPPVEVARFPAPKKTDPGPTASPGDLDQLLHAAEEFVELEDPEAAMELIVKAEKIADDHPRVKKLHERVEAALQALYEDKIGPLESVPRVTISAEQIVALNLDHRAGFVLSQIDGSLSFEDLFSLSGMSRIDTSRILSQLLEMNVISRA